MSRAKKIAEIEDKIYALTESYKIDNLDPIIIANLKSTNSNLKNMMTAVGKENLDSLINAELTWTPLEKLKIYDTTIDISSIFQNFGKIQ